ncbi:hypothetical protein B0H16DRAFT_678331 [Mycena metata]|uniref:Uncharacterized protein n=1 Tax=Mycena metata TaxID=1033252 RepID=A0AAD7J808_9AGAR|nr:hypothetical protein B0H16DRAFT_678331 [Mycena metata]
MEVLVFAHRMVSSSKQVTSWIKGQHDNGANHIDLITFSSPPLGLATNLPEDLRHWSTLSTAPFPRQRILWFSTDSTEILGAAEEIVVKTFFTTGRFQISIDVRGSQSVTVAFMRKLASISPHYMSALVLYSCMWGFTVLEEYTREVQTALPLIVPPYKRILRKHGLTTLIIHGVNGHATEQVYRILSALKESHGLNIVVMCEPGVRPERQQLNGFDEYDGVQPEREVQTLYVSDDGLIMYSGRTPSEPALYKNLFRILLEGVWQRPDATSLRCVPLKYQLKGSNIWLASGELCGSVVCPSISTLKAQQLPAYAVLCITPGTIPDGCSRLSQLWKVQCIWTSNGLFNGITRKFVILCVYCLVSARTSMMYDKSHEPTP